MEEFIENTKKCQEKGSVWTHFLKSTTKEKAKCKLCYNVLKCAGGSTSTLRSHLKNKHKIVLDSSVATIPLENETEASTSTGAKRPKKITDFIPSAESMELTVSRLVCLDGLTFRVFANSVDLRRLFKKSGFTLPSSANSIRSIVMQFCENVKLKVVDEIFTLKKKDEKFSVTLDEWVSNRNRRFMNINLHSSMLNKKQFINLGLVRIEGSATALKCVNSLIMRLDEFGLSLARDVAGLTTDGASVMVKMGKALPVYHQLCYAHVIQLAVLDVLYKPNQTQRGSAIIIQEDIHSDSDVDADDEEDGIADITVDMESQQILNLSHPQKRQLIEKVRRTCKLFRKSTTKNDVTLQKYVKEKFGQDLCLMLDCKTRWSSMCTMIERFLKLYDCIQKALLDLKSDLRFTDDDITVLTHMHEVLEILKGVVEVLCQEDATLLTADAALKYMFKKLTGIQSDLSFDLQIALRKRISDRYLSIPPCVLKYLDNPREFFEEQDFNYIFIKPTPDVIKSIIAALVTETGSNSIIVSNTRSNCDVTMPSQSQPIFKSFKDELLHFLKPTTSEASTTATETEELVESLPQMILCEMALHENGGGRGKFLTKAFNSLITVKPTSVEAERAFSTAGYFCSKVRSRLNDSTLNTLIFLRSYFLSQKQH